MIMKKYTNIFVITFITYILMIFARPYVTAQVCADLCLFLFILAIIYQIVYITYFRKKDNVNFVKSLFMYFICALSTISIYIIIDYIDMFFNGYTPINFIGQSIGDTYYGFEAIFNCYWKNIFYIPYLIFNVIILIIYSLKNKRKK